MPEMDGYEVSRRIRATPGNRRVLLIALTGWGQEDDVRRSRAAGFDHHLLKPPDVDKLRDLLASSVSGPVGGSYRD
jgi:CheY-like chemotaxis protein